MPTILNHVNFSPNNKNEKKPVTMGIKFEIVFARFTPKFFIPQVNNINANDDAKTANSSNGIHTFHEKGIVIKLLKSNIKNNGKNINIPIKF